MFRHRMRWVTGAVVALLAFVSWAGRADDAPTPALDQRLAFVAGGAAGLSVAATPWKTQDLRWIVKSDAGTLAQDVQKSDGRGGLTIRFAVPDVRVAVRLVLSIAPQDEPGAAQAWEVVVLPKDPLADSRKTLQALGVGVLPPGPLTAAVKRSGLTVTELQYDLARSEFKGKVVLLGGLLAGGVDATRRWIASLPKGTCLVAVASGAEANALGAILPCLKAEAVPQQAVLHVDQVSPVWSDLRVEWLGTKPPSAVLTQPRGVLSVRVLAGHMDREGNVFPLVLEAGDAAGHFWLVWNPTWSTTAEDPRWDLLLHSSLLWADQKQRHPSGPDTRPAT